MQIRGELLPARTVQKWLHVFAFWQNMKLSSEGIRINTLGQDLFATDCICNHRDFLIPSEIITTFPLFTKNPCKTTKWQQIPVANKTCPKVLWYTTRIYSAIDQTLKQVFLYVHFKFVAIFQIDTSNHRTLLLE